MRPIETWLASGSLAAKIMGSLLCFMAVALPCMADSYWNVGVSGGRSGLDGFSFSIGEYYGVPEREVIVIHDRGIYEEELPVVFYLARQAHVRPGYVVDLRLSGMSWMDITLYLGLVPDIYYVPVVIDRRWYPYGPHYRYYHHHPRGGWTRHDLDDRDIINQVNLRFMSERHHYAPEKIMRYRSEGRSFHDIDRYISRDQQGKTITRKRSDSDRNDLGRNQETKGMTRQNQRSQVLDRQHQSTHAMAKPDDWGELSFRQDRQPRNMSGQSRKVHHVIPSGDDQQNTVQQPKQLRHMTRQEF